MPAPPRWLLAVPDAIRQLEALDLDLLTRRDVERLFGVSRARATDLIAPLFDLVRSVEDAIHRARRTEVGPLIEQRGVHLRRRLIDEARVEQI